jgi:uncharacterized phage protein gp47/JayE
MTWSRPALDTLVDDALADIDANVTDTDARLAVSILSVLGVVTSGQTDGLYGYIARIAKQIPWVSADGDALHRWASLPHIYPTPARAATGLATVIGTRAGATVAAGAILTRGDGAEYVAQADATLAAGTASLSIAALDPGANGNAAAGVKLTLAESVSGITAIVVGPDGLVGGAEAEEDSSLLDRFLSYWRSAEEGAGPYVKLARAAGATRAWEYEFGMGLGTITVRFVLDGKPDTIVPTDAEVAIVNAYMQTFRPPGSKGLYVVAPVADPVDVRLAIIPDTAATRAAALAEITDFMRREAEPGMPTIRSRLSEAISAAAGEYKHRLVAPAADVDRAAYKIGTLGTVTWETY